MQESEYYIKAEFIPRKWTMISWKISQISKREIRKHNLYFVALFIRYPS
jgi:hypothetical protein